MADTPKLTRVKRLDSVPLEKVEYTPEGFLIDTPIVTSVGIFEYHAPNGGARRELRLPEHVFAPDSLDSYEGKPVIITHEAGRVNKENVTEEIVGTILTKGYKDGDDVRAKIVIHDIDNVKRSGFRELSLGYDLTLDETPGEWNGQPYDAIQTEIVINHLAVVNDARAGEQARLNIDGKTQNLKGAKSMAKLKKAMNADEMKKSIRAFEERRKHRLDEAEAAQDEPKTDNESEVTEEIKENGDTPRAAERTLEDRVALIRDRRDRRDADGDPDDPEQAKAVIANQDEDIEQLLEIVEELQAEADLAGAAQQDNEPEKEDCDIAEQSGGGSGGEIVIKMNADSVDAAVVERLKLVRIGDRLNLDGMETLKPLDAKRRIIRAVKPNLRLDGKGERYVNTAFDIVLQELGDRKGTDYQQQQMFNTDGRTRRINADGSANKARERMIDRMMNGGQE